MNPRTRLSLPLLAAAVAAFLAGSAMAKGCGAPAQDAVLTLALPGAAAAAAASPDGCTVYVAIPAKGPAPGRIAVVSRKDGQVAVTRVLTPSGSPAGLAVSPDGGRLAAATGMNVTLFDTARILAGQPDAIVATLDEPGAAGVLFGKDGRRVYVSNAVANTLGVWDLAGGKRLASLAIGLSPGPMALSPDGRRLYVADRLTDGKEADCSSFDGQASWTSTGELAVVDVATAVIVARTSAGCGPAGIAVSPSGDAVYIAAQGDGAVRVFDAAGAAGAAGATLKVGEAPTGIAAAGRLFVGAGHAVSVLDPAKGTSASVPTNGSTGAMAITPDRQALLVITSAPDALLIIDPARLGAAGR